MNKYRIITTKAVYYSEDQKACNNLVKYPSEVEYGKKLPFPIVNTLDKKRVAINPQYIVSIECEEIEEKK